MRRSLAVLIVVAAIGLVAVVLVVGRGTGPSIHHEPLTHEIASVRTAGAVPVRVSNSREIAPACVQASPPSETDRGTILGRVVSANLSPLSGVKCELILDYRTPDEAKAAESSTNEAGEFRLKPTGTPASTALLVVSAEQMASRYIPLLPMIARHGGYLGDVTLDSGTRVTGIVRGGVHGPPVSATVVWTGTRGDRDTIVGVCGSARADDSGRFDLGMLRPGALEIRVLDSHTGSPLALAHALIPPDANEVVIPIDIEQLRPWELDITAADGGEVPAISVTMLDSASSTYCIPVVIDGRSDDGGWMISLPMSFEGDLCVSASGYTSEYVSIAPSLPHTMAIRLSPGGDSVRVKLAGALEGSDWQYGMTTGGLYLPALRSAKGPGDEFVVRGVTHRVYPGYRVIVVSKDLHQYGISRPILPADLREDAPAIVVECRETDALRVKAVDARSMSPLSNAVVKLSGCPERAAQHDSAWGGFRSTPTGIVLYDDAVASGESDEHGVVQFRVVPDLNYRVWAESPGYAPASAYDVRGSARTVELRLNAAAAIIASWDSNVGVPRLAAVDRSGRVRVPVETGDGYCRFDGLNAGDYLVGSEAAVLVARRTIANWTEAMAVASALRITYVRCTPGDVTNVDLAMVEAPAWIAGTVADDSLLGVTSVDAIPAGSTIRMSSRPVAVGEDRAFQIGPLGAGRYLVRFFTSTSRGFPVYEIPVSLSGGSVWKAVVAPAWAKCEIHVPDGTRSVRVTRQSDQNTFHVPVRNSEVVRLDVMPGFYQWEALEDPSVKRDRSSVGGTWVECVPGLTVIDLE